jgi:hypothetical protein
MPGVGIRRDDGFFGNGNHRVGADSNEQLPGAGDSMHSHRRFDALSSACAEGEPLPPNAKGSRR